MKKSILALGALAVAGGLGLAGSAQAVVALAVGGITTTNTDPTTTTNAGKLELNAGGAGHNLIVPYYSAQDGTYTMLSIVNTDYFNGKAVKVRFRGAANADDVLDFTVFLSARDVWTAAVVQGPGGKAQLISDDNSCTLPARAAGQPQFVSDFITNRFPGYMSAENKAANTREGYIEILNMADIPLRVWNKTNLTVLTKNALYTAIKPVDDKAPCAAIWNTNGNSSNDGIDAIAALLDTEWRTDGRLLSADYGLHSPTGGLQGGWIIINQTNHAQFSGNATAVKAYSMDATGASVARAVTDVLFAPQNDLTFTGEARRYTADPLLTGSKYHDASATPLVAALNYDLPDLSTPMAGAAALSTPSIQARELAAMFSHLGEISNEFIYDPAGAKTGVPMSTDWVLSQVTRRYFAAVNYADTSANSTIVYNDACTSDGEPACVNGGINKLSLPYAGSSRPANFAGTPDRHGGTGVLWLDRAHAFGPQACLTQINASFTNREAYSPLVVLLPANPSSVSPLCGEVATMRWGDSPLRASITSAKASDVSDVYPYTYTAGWGTIMFTPGADGGMYPPGTTGMTGVRGGIQPTAYLPIAGFAALLGVNGVTKAGFGAVYPHRWD